MHKLRITYFLLLSVSLWSCKYSHEKKETGISQKGLHPTITAMLDEVSADSIENNVRMLVSFGSRHSLSDTKSDTFGIGAARRWVAKKMEAYAANSNGRMAVELDPFVVSAGRRIPYTIEMKNVVATLAGTDPDDDRVMLVSGHLDSRVSDVMDSTSFAPGANDDASGVALVMELARVMAKHEFPATIIFMAVQGEEQGLLGAKYMAEKLKKDSINLIAMFNNDMVGNTLSSETGIHDDSTVRIFSETIPAFETEDMERLRKYTGAENDSRARQLARYIKSVGEKYVDNFSITLNYRIDRYLRGGDHLPFSQNGFAAVRFCEMNENYLYQHQDVRKEGDVQYGDLPEYVNYDYAAKITQVNLAALANLALSPYQPENVGLKVDLGNQTTLVWEHPSKGPKPKGYNILIRETYQATWEQSIYVEDTTAIIPYSKDNFFFAVQSVGNNDTNSLPVFPTPAR
ncbi:Leucine aminopeptidase-related protein [Fulvivirga imtechensis AK7]|uniref:Leucine aminopeptidase-related protein n=1 Tax=Fulvivirga imtechensis AK7 TaxID=1237149 RepID=L8JPA3_9BACT|nr:M20/M25/M40 family metallo-hydrolase [Fulvivirga imtechensis]ELR69334.1 Leucine aminopeptidase-related protein [Fulvivirga imtechensis AK7]